MVLSLVRGIGPERTCSGSVFFTSISSESTRRNYTGREKVAVKGAQAMNEASVYIVERNAWSIERQCDVHFRLTYERVFLPVQNLWRDFLVHSEEIGSALPN